MFKEEVAPWEKEVIADPSTPRAHANPFAYVAEEKTDVSTFNSFFFIIPFIFPLISLH